MPELIVPIRENRDSAGAPAIPEVQVASRELQPSVPRQRWLHSDTVDELRVERALMGLAVPRRAARVPRSPLSRSAWLPEGFPVVGPDRQKAQGTAAPIRYLLAASLAVLAATAVGALAAVAAFAARVPLPGQ